MKKIILYLFFAVSAMYFPASPLSAENVSDKARGILQHSTEILKDYKGVEIHFSVIIRNEKEKKETVETGEGTAYVDGDRYRIEAGGMITLYDGKDLYTYNPDIKEVSVSNAEDGDSGLLQPQNLLKIHDMDFKFRYIGKEKDCNIVELLPHDKGKGFSKVLVRTDIATGLIRSVMSFSKDGNIVLVIINKLKNMNGAIPEGYFNYSKENFPGAELVDLRL